MTGDPESKLYSERFELEISQSQARVITIGLAQTPLSIHFLY